MRWGSRCAARLCAREAQFGLCRGPVRHGVVRRCQLPNAHAAVRCDRELRKIGQQIAVADLLRALRDRCGRAALGTLPDLMQQIRERRLLEARDRTPHDVQLVLCARQRHVREPRVLGQRLALAASAAAAGIPACRGAQEQGRAIRRRAIVKQRRAALVLVQAARAPTSTGRIRSETRRPFSCGWS